MSLVVRLDTVPLIRSKMPYVGVKTAEICKKKKSLIFCYHLSAKYFYILN